MRIAALIVLLSICSCAVPNEPEDPLAPTETASSEQPEAVERVGLTTASCADLEKRIEDLAIQELRVATYNARESALSTWEWYRENKDRPYFVDAGSAASGGGSGSAPTNFTTTNTQHADIDEPDIIKNDGTRLFVISGRKLFATSTWPAAQLRTRSAIDIEGQPFEMLLVGDRVLVFSRVFEASFGTPYYCAQYSCGGWYTNATAVTWVDVSDLDQLRVIERRNVPGSYQTARRVDDTVRLVTSTSMRVGEIVDVNLEWNTITQASSRAALITRFNQLFATNEAKLRARRLAHWLPGVTFDEATCADVWLTNASSQLGATHVTSLRVSDPTSFQRQTLMASVDLVYQGESLFLAQRQWWWSFASSHRDYTYLYRFDLSQDERVNFVAAGRIDGLPSNQFALDEHRGKLRVAVTDEDTNFGSRNRVVVLATQGTTLVTIGSTPDLAPGERIMSARFFGDRGYVVTFRQVDPLYSLDLSDDTNPRVTGELKIPGFSSYIHPLDETHLLTIGTYIPETGTWPRSVQLQIFDVSDPSQPRQSHTQLVGEDWGSSEAQWNHKAFNYFPAKKLLAVPFFQSTWADGTYSFESDLRVFTVDAQTGFESKGAIAIDDMLGACSGSCWSWYWQPAVRRSVMADDFVYAVTSGGVRVAHVDSLATPLATAVFPAAP